MPTTPSKSRKVRARLGAKKVAQKSRDHRRARRHM